MVDEKRQPAAVKAAKPAAKTSKPAAAKADPGRRYRGVSEAARQAERRQRFIEAGLTVFGSRGYHSSTVRSICSEAGLTERYFYESFANSEDLLCVVYEHVNQRIRAGAGLKFEFRLSDRATAYAKFQHNYYFFDSDRLVYAASDSATPLGWRWNSATPSSFSSPLICWLSGGCWMPRRSAARVMWPASATARK